MKKNYSNNRSDVQKTVNRGIACSDQMIIGDVHTRMSDLESIAKALKPLLVHNSDGTYSTYRCEHLECVGNRAVISLGESMVSAGNYIKSRGIGSGEWYIETGTKYLTWTIYDYMRANNHLPPLKAIQKVIVPDIINNDVQQIEEEDEAMINELKNQLTQIKAQIEQQANKLAEKDGIIENQGQALAEKDNVIAEKDGIILEEQNKNIIANQKIQSQKEENQVLKDLNSDLTGQLASSEEKNIFVNQELQSEKEMTKNLKESNLDLTEQLASSKEANVMLQEQVGNLTEEKLEITNKFNASEEKNIDLQNKLDVSNALVIPLKERVEELKDYKKSLENDKIELREFNKMLVDDKKMLQEEKKLLLTDKKHFQDLTLEQNIKITELSQIKCNDPNHYDIIDSNVMGQLPLNNQLNDLE